MNKTKVLVFESYPFFSGAQKITRNFCEVLKRNDFHITLLLADDPEGILQNRFDGFVDEIIVLKRRKALTLYGNADRWFNMNVIIKTFFFGLLPFYTECFKKFRKGNYAYYYFCDPRGAVLMSIPTSFFKGEKICYLQSKNKLSPLLARLIFFTFNDHILCPSVDVFNSLPASSKKKVLYYGVDFCQYETIDKNNVVAEINAVLNNENLNRKKLLYAGLIKPHKGVHHLIYAFKYLKDNLKEKEMPVLFLLGSPKNDPERRFLNELKHFSKINDIDKYIYWMGWKNNVLEWMSCSDYFIFCTIDMEKCYFDGFDEVIESSEGSPVVLIESSLCGLFALASEVTGVNETIIDYHNGIKYNPNTPNAFNEALKEIILTAPSFIDFPSKDKFSIEKFESGVLNIVKR